MPVRSRDPFTYAAQAPIAPGSRVLVTVRRGSMIGVVVPSDSKRTAYAGRLSPIREVLDPERPSLPAPLLELLLWASDYYHHPLGQVLHAALPVRLRDPEPAPPPVERPQAYRAAPDLDLAAARKALAHAPKQLALLEQIVQLGPQPVAALRDLPGGTRAARPLIERGWLVAHVEPEAPAQAAEAFSDEQRAAVAALNERPDEFGVSLLQGVTGSGKTEVFLEAARSTLAAGRSILLLVPEIALTPQLIRQVRMRLGLSVAVLHSRLTPVQQHLNWQQIREGRIKAVLGTRSALFAPLENLGLIVIDEEHDPAYKQIEGFRYNARDLGIKLASLHQARAVLSSATPCLETLHAAQTGRYRALGLSRRHAGAPRPELKLLDLNQHPANEGLSAPLVAALRLRLERGEQSILFRNRRGFSLRLACHACGWQADCPNCSAPLIYYAHRETLRCHHCDRSEAAPTACPNCARRPHRIGVGTERLVARLATLFPEARVLQLDRDQITSHTRLERAFADIHAGETDIIVGTQLTAKGHDFAHVSLIGVVNADAQLFSMDFRAPERMFQQLLQLAGRAGRRGQPGEVLIQTHYPRHRLLARLLEQDYPAFAAEALEERARAHFPPYRHLALWRAEAADPAVAQRFLERVARLGHTLNQGGCKVFDVLPAPIERIARRFRFQLLVSAEGRGPRRSLLERWHAEVLKIPDARKLRWSLDIDPIDLS